MACPTRSAKWLLAAWTSRTTAHTCFTTFRCYFTTRSSTHASATGSDTGATITVIGTTARTHSE